LPAIAHIFTINYVAEMLGEDEEWLHELSLDMFPEHGCLAVYNGKDDALTAFTDQGIENLKQMTANAANQGSRPRRSTGRPSGRPVVSAARRRASAISSGSVSMSAVTRPSRSTLLAAYSLRRKRSVS